MKPMSKTVCGGMLLVLLAGQALADGGQVNITGNILANSCEVDNGGTDKDVYIGQFSTADFPSKGSTTQAKSFVIALKNCTAGIKGTKVWFSGQQAAGDNTLLALTDTGQGTAGVTATGVGVEILDASMNSIPVNNTESTQFPLEPDSNKLTFNLRYKSTGTTVTAGDADAVLYFDMQYE
ncbi:fimbrial protein [Klebsiella aerogenes]|uniref:fimbrial protein n=1 Tax=Klebsiella aerogenes TaxID=548 RepID=UPI0034D2C156